MRPYEQLPFPAPADYNPGPAFFYNNFVKHFIPDMIQMMDVGLDIDDKAVEELRKTIDVVLASVDKRLTCNPLIKQYQENRLPAAQKAYAEKCTEAIRELEYYIKPFNDKDMLHRTWVVNAFLATQDKYKDHKDKWSMSDLKKFNIWGAFPFIRKIIDKEIKFDHDFAIIGMRNLAEYKLELWNRPRYDKAEKPVPMAPFNPGSPKQKQEFFEMLEVKPLAFSKDTGEPSWGRKQLEILLERNPDPFDDLFPVLEAFIDHSYSAIIKNNFIKAFDSCTIDGVLHGNIKLFGAKSFRNTSNSPNLLNAPSTGSIYAKPFKRCIKSPDGHVIYTADLSGLEDRVIANLSGDENKQNIFNEDLDGHSLNSCIYFKDDIEKIMGPNTDNIPYIREFFRLHDVEKNSKISLIRFKSKEPTFKLAYGGYPDAHKGGVITQELFDNYHNVLYPGITRYREQYVLPTTKRQGYIHLGLGCIMYSSDPDADIRTLNNATVQFWSILTLIAINEFNHRIREEGLEKEVKVCSTIYDSIYNKVLADPEIIKWVNDNLIELMCVQYLEDEPIHNEASGDIGLNWADLHKLSNNASIDEVTEVLGKIL